MLRLIKVYKLEKMREIFIIFEPAKIMFSYYPLLDYCVLKNRSITNPSIFRILG